LHRGWSKAAVIGVLIVAAAMLLPGRASGIPAPQHLMYPSTQCLKSATGLNDCIAAATPGSTITIKPGVYFEHGTTISHTSITVTGSCGSPSSVVIDQGATGDGFDVNAANATVSCLTLRHGGTSWLGVDNLSANAGLHVSKVLFYNEDSGVYQNTGGADGLSVTNSTFQGIAGNAIYSNTVANATISGNTVTNTDSDCINITSLSNSTIANNNLGACNGDGIDDGGGATDTITGNKVHSVDGDCFDLGSASTTVTKNTLFGCNGTGIYMYGNTATVTLNKISGQVDGDTIELSCSDNGVVSGNVSTSGNDDDPFIYVCQNNPGTETITNNTVSNGLVSYGVDCSTCDNAVVTGNKILSGGEEDAIDVYGAKPIVNNNVGVGGWDSETFYVDCASSCAAAQVEKNTESGSNDDYGFYISSAGCGSFPCMTISNNTATDNVEAGFYFSTTYALVSNNKATFSGYGYTGCGASYSGFAVVAAFNHLTGNTSSNNGCSGFYVNANSNVLTSNTSSVNSVFGFQIAGDLNTLHLNTATHNHADGFNNDGTNTTLTTNHASGNRQDCTSDVAESATILLMSGNVCADHTNFGAESTLPGW
jgi:parallel beta-helix repeat protein